MTDDDQFRHYKRFLNPSLNDRFDYDPAGGFAPELSIQENCWHSEGSGQSNFGFFLDGHYHSLIMLTRWPRTTYPGIIQRLTNLRLLDYPSWAGRHERNHAIPYFTWRLDIVRDRLHGTVWLAVTRSAVAHGGGRSLRERKI